MSELPLAALHRMIKKSTGLRVSDDAAKQLGEMLEADGEKIARNAADLAKHAKRKTIVAGDIRLAAKK
ncbi:MAG: histone [archaeon]